ncbi:MAG: peroxidase-related enzyme [Alphaproteobacteria bacterium]|nr:peroxidase-related enzyme [Alphaproteobacteria bacterium]
MTWISTIAEPDANGRLKQLYRRVAGPDGRVDNILKAHSLRPHTLEGHMALYKHVLHNSANTVPKATLESIGLYVSLLNRCGYCVDHHFEGLRRLLGDAVRANSIRQALQADDPAAAFQGAELAMLLYARTLTRTPAAVSARDIADLRAAGLEDGEILEINQVISYFGYANRTVLGLGVTTEGDILGLSPNDAVDPDNWTHR